MTLNEFLENPIGKGDASINVTVLRQALSAKYDIYQKTKYKQVKMSIYKQPLKDVYWIWLEMPTETERDNTYDVVYKFTNPKPTDRTSLGIGKFDIQIFANVPSFAYTFAYVYNANELLIDTLSSKLGKDFISKTPDVRNRNQVLLFDKYVYFGARYILDSKVLNRMVADSRASRYQQDNFNSKIRTLSTIMDEYKIADKKLRAKKGKPKNNSKEEKRSDVGGVKRISGKKSGVNNISKNAAKKSTIKKKGTVTKR